MTWYSVLNESCSQIRYSPTFSFQDQVGSGMEGALYNTDRNGKANVFNLEHNEDGLWLNNNWDNPDNRWNPDNEFMFVVRNTILFRIKNCGFSFLDYASCFSNRQTFYQFHQVLL